MSKRYKTKRRFRYYTQHHKCMVRGCRGFGRECYLEIWRERPDEVLCWDHARDGGYCPGCGLFWAGVESFDFSRSGLCEQCRIQREADDYDYEQNWDEGDFEGRGYCDTCQNLGYLNCYCGGDLCICENNGEYPCPDCG